MRLAIVFLFSLQAFAVDPKDDPSYCAYWLHRLERISVWEEQRCVDVPMIERDQGFMPATDLDVALSEKIQREMHQIERDCRK